MQGIIFDIQRFSLFDGPGIRTTVFLKGCMMRCIWCHNPESFTQDIQLSYDANKCTGCRNCEVVCTSGVHRFINETHYVKHNQCTHCGKCTAECPGNALKLLGQSMTADEIINEVMKDKKYFEHCSGGVTFSGGEPSLQFDFLVEMLQLAKQQNLHVCMDTNGVMDKNRLELLMKYVDLFLFDYKITDPEQHKSLTSVPKDIILDNLKFLGEKNRPVILRCPIIPGINDRDDHFQAIHTLKHHYKNIQKVELMPYHNIGRQKWDQLGYDFTLNSLPSSTPQQWSSKEIFINTH